MASSELYNQIWQIDNLNQAIAQVRKNDGSPGVDKVTTKSFFERFYDCHSRLVKLRKHFKSKFYKPQPVKRVLIPKEDGSKRPLGIPCVIDRVAQQATAQVLSNYFEPLFSNSSFGFRPEKSAHDALYQAKCILEDGNIYVIDMDLAKFFDTVNHDKLLEVIYKRTEDNKLRSFIRKFLQAPIFENHKVQPSLVGTPQGGRVSPVLANILLNELDQILDQRGIKFVRYADDMIIFAKSKRAIKRIYKSTKKIIENELLLQINETKTKIGKFSPKYKFLGHCFMRTVGSKKIEKIGKVNVSLHAKTKEKFKNRVRELTPRRCYGGYDENQKALEKYLKGWFNYYWNCYDLNPSVFESLDSFLRRRLRKMKWTTMKSPTKRRAFVREHVPYMENKIGYSSKRIERVASNWLNKVMPNWLLHQLGYVDLGKMYYDFKAQGKVSIFLTPSQEKAPSEERGWNIKSNPLDYLAAKCKRDISEYIFLELEEYQDIPEEVM